MVVMGMAGGAAWAFIPVFLRARGLVNETTGINAGLSQRLLGKLTLNLNAGMTFTSSSDVQRPSFQRTCSTGGGFKGLRMGITFKGLIQDVKELMSPGSAVTPMWFHHIRDTLLTDSHTRAAMLIILSYIGIYSFGTVLGMYYGYDIVSAMFDSVSAGSNTGLSAGLTAPSMPDLLKIVYIIEMWMGRLEFMSIFALIGWFIAVVKGK